MKVFIVELDLYQDRHIKGIFSTWEQAYRCALLPEDRNIDSSIRVWTLDGLEIAEYTIVAMKEDKEVSDRPYRWTNPKYSADVDPTDGGKP